MTSDSIPQSPVKKQAPHLLEEPTIAFYPSLATLIGVNEAIILQQLHFLLGITERAKNHYNLIDGRWWVYNSYEQWRVDHFPWLASSTIKRLFLDMEKSGFVISRQSVKSPTDRKKWYSIDYGIWSEFVARHELNQSDAPYQFDTVDGTKKKPSRSYQNNPMEKLKKSRSLTETTSEKKEERDSLPPSISIALDRANEAGKTPSDNGMAKYMDADVLIRAFERAHRESGIPQTVRRGKNVYQAAGQYWDDGYRENEVYDTVKELIANLRPLAFVFLSEALSEYRLKHKARPAPKEVVNGNARPVPVITNWQREDSDE